MTKKQQKQEKQFREYITRLVCRLQVLTLAHEWKLTINFDHWCDNHHASEEDSETCAYISILDEYRTARINVGSPTMRKYFAEKNGYEMMSALLHELCHLLIHPIYLHARDGVTNQTHTILKQDVERQTSRVCHILEQFVPAEFYLIG